MPRPRSCSHRPYEGSQPESTCVASPSVSMVSWLSPRWPVVLPAGGRPDLPDGRPVRGAAACVHRGRWTPRARSSASRRRARTLVSVQHPRLRAAARGSGQEGVLKQWGGPGSHARADVPGRSKAAGGSRRVSRCWHRRRSLTGPRSCSRGHAAHAVAAAAQTAQAMGTRRRGRRCPRFVPVRAARLPQSNGPHQSECH